MTKERFLEICSEENIPTWQAEQMFEHPEWKISQRELNEGELEELLRKTNRLWRHQEVGIKNN